MRGKAPENLDGRRFASLVVLYEAGERTPAGKRRFVCRCDCGKDVTVIGADIKSGRTTSCGCARSRGAAERSEARRQDFAGAVFGTVAVIRISDRWRQHASDDGARSNGIKRTRLWVCRCQCGEEFHATIASLKLGQVSGCGCVHAERRIAAGKARAQRVELLGQEMTIHDASAVGGIDVPTLRWRIQRGMTVDEAAFKPPMRSGRKGQPRVRVPF